jgi:hypothetical protein
MATFKRGKIWWYDFIFAGRRIRESAKTTSKTVAKLAEQQRRRDLEKGFNGLEDSRDERSTWKSTDYATRPPFSQSMR